MAAKKSNTSTKNKPASAAETDKPISKDSKTEINELFAQALARHKNEIFQDKKQKYKELDHLALITKEYLSCFSLIGYTMQGEQVCIFDANNSRDEAALVDLMRATFLELANNRP